MTEFITPYNKSLSMPAACRRNGAWTAPRSLLSLSNEILRQAAMIGYLNAFYLMAFTALAAMPLAALMRRVKREP